MTALPRPAADHIRQPELSKPGNLYRCSPAGSARGRYAGSCPQRPDCHPTAVQRAHHLGDDVLLALSLPSYLSAFIGRDRELA
jgi:hypothetical protein